MGLSGNKGDWSEIYAFFKLLSDGRLYPADGQLKKYEDEYYPILEIFRDDSVDRNAYKIQAAKNSILVAGKTTSLEIPQARFAEQAAKLLEHIRSIIGNTAEFDDIEKFMSEIGTYAIKAKSQDKADIRIIIHNIKTGCRPELGYSIKSRLGARSTLINANRDGTNFIYRVRGISESDADKFNCETLFKKKFRILDEAGASIEYIGTSPILRDNLMILDMGMEHLVAESMLEAYRGNGKDVSEVTKRITSRNPLNIPSSSAPLAYEYKMKQFLLAFALGMTGSTSWDGKFNANGGYIVVKEDGDVVCYHFFDRNDFEDYLYFNTEFDTPSTSRHKFGNIYNEAGEYFLKLNLQIRFK